MILDLISKKEEVKPFNIGDKIGYAFGDLGCGAFFMFVSSYLMLFYTDILGISATAVGTLFLVARIWDAINDPIMGTICDRVKVSKYGKFKPYIVRFGIPMVLVGILTFTAIPILPENLTLPYAYITYILFGMLYTAVNIPYGSLSSVMSKDPNERAALSVFRNLGGLLAQIIIVFLVPKLVFNIDGEITAVGFLKCAIILAIISSISFIITFRFTRERIVHNKLTKNNDSFLKSILKLFKNRAFLGIALASFAQMAGLLTTQGLTAYLFKDYFKAPSLISIGGLSALISSFLVIPFATKIISKLGKKETAVFSCMWSTIIYALVFFIPNLNVNTYIILMFINGLGQGLMSAVTWALVSDTIDYQEYITGERNEGTVYSSYSLARKLAQAISGGFAGFALGILGYQSGSTTQTEDVATGIKALATGIPALCLLATTLILIFVYNLSKKKINQITKELEIRRQHN
ncbi:MFS transporter [[Clostridium] colinum]|uniref:MFS transporter n=1 Tax=[Clostridium] colinum TaxID=36835 RepID=UPI00202517B3|nr:MFS transporter [[Clostridium] colinum]